MTGSSDEVVGLLNCPFCGSESVSVSYATNLDNVITNRFVECEDCAACGPAHPPETRAITAWNTRPPPSGRVCEASQAVRYLRLIAQGWEVIESDGSQMTIQAPSDWEDGETELVVNTGGLLWK